MLNETIRRFGYPDLLIAEYSHWVVLLRAQQVTCGALVVALKSDVTSFALADEAAFVELKVIAGQAECVLTQCVAYEKINYLMLMMVDPHVHFHVIPRYQGLRTIAEVAVGDGGWPARPIFENFPNVTHNQLVEMTHVLRRAWGDV